MTIRRFRPREELEGYISAIWALASPDGLPSGQASIVIPNGCPKLVLPLSNCIASFADGVAKLSHEDNLYLVGNRITSTRLSTTTVETIFVTVEFTPQGCYAIFGIPMAETANGLWNFNDLLRDRLDTLRERIWHAGDLEAKVAILQEWLCGLLAINGKRSEIVDFCVEQLRSTDGRIAVKGLEERSGYSCRYINRLFNEYIGLSPKNLAGIFRVNRIHTLIANQRPWPEIRRSIYDYYYDQSHFIHEFRRVTGLPPKTYADQTELEFGRLLTLD